MVRRRGRSGTRPAGRRRPRGVPEWRLYVSGFKSIRDSLEIPLRPLTLFCGDNSSGKTSVFQPLLLVKQTLEVAYDPGPLLLAGDNVGFSSTSEMLWRGRGKDVAARMSVGLIDFDGEATRLMFRKAPRGVELEQVDYRPPLRGDGYPEAFTLRANSGREDLERAVGSAYRALIQAAPAEEYELRIKRSRCFFDVAVSLAGREATDRGVAAPDITVTSYGMLVNRATNTIHLPGLRDQPSRFYPATQVGEVFPGVFQPYVASIIASWGETRDARLQRLGEEMSLLGLTWKVEAKRIDDTRVALRVGRLPKPTQGGARDLVNIADVGLGVSQTLPVLVALQVARRDQFVYLEQPEIHLHPRAQVALAELLVQAARRGVVVIAETHSYLLLRAIQEVTARTGETQLVKLHWFDRDESGATHVDSADLGPDGSFGDWPADFSDVELEVEERYLRTALGTPGGQ